MSRPVKMEAGSRARSGVEEGVSLEGVGSGTSRQEVTERRALRSRYLAVKNLISDERDDIGRQDSKRFKSIIAEVEALHEHVKKPREQVADAEALLDIANTLATSVRSQSNDGLAPSDFVSVILKNFGQQEHRSHVDNPQDLVSWTDIGIAVCDIFKAAPGCSTMIGPMRNEIKQRKAVVHRKRTKPTESTCPEEIDSNVPETMTDTDKNMSTIFNILKKNRSAKLENLVLNRSSFAQTVENIFALSFLAKDGRVEITVDGKGHHLVSPKNAPPASAVASGKASYHHFVFRFDFKDWKLMMDIVRPGEELMPHRSPSNSVAYASQSDPVHGETQANAPSSSQANAPSTPIRKLTRNRGLIIQEGSVVEDSLEKDSSSKMAGLTGKGKRLFNG